MPTPPPLEKLFGAALLAVVAAGAVAAALTEDAFAPVDAPVSDGSWAAKWEDRLDDNFAPRQWGVEFWGVVEWTLFQRGRPGVVVGEADWLFTSEEFEVLPERDALVADKLARILVVRDRLAARDIQLVVALVPAKARVYDDSVTLPGPMRDTYDPFRAALVEAGIPAPDLVAPLQAARSQGAVYFSTDTHWTPLGASVVAAELRRAVPDWTPQDGATFAMRGGDPVEIEGDLLRYVPLGPLQGRIGPGPESAPGRALTGEAPAAGLLGDVEIPITVVGTSYTANPTWGFADELKAAFQADVLNAAKEGFGPILPMEEWTEDPSFEENPPRLVVWEVPERYLGRPDR